MTADITLRGKTNCTIVKDTKNWWAQAEGLNALLLFSRIFPADTRYPAYFQRQWEYVNEYIIDSERGDWFEGGIDKEPHFRTVRKKSYVEMHVSYGASSYELQLYSSRGYPQRGEQVHQLLA